MKIYENINVGLYEYVKQMNEKYKDFVAINYLGRKILFSEFMKNVEKVKEAFSKSGIEKNDVVSVLGLATPETIYAIYALDSLGAAVNFLNPIEPESIKETIEFEEPNVIICYDRFYPMIEGMVDNYTLIITTPFDSLPTPVKIVGKLKEISQNGKINIPKESKNWKEFVKDGIKLNYPKKERSENIRGVHLGSGGSSGLPKQIQLSPLLLNNIIKQHYIMNESSAFDLNVNRGEVLLDVIPPHLGYGICDIHLALSFGLVLALAPDPEPKKFVKMLLKYEPNFILAGPVHWKEYIKIKIKTPYIKTAVSGGEKLEKEIEDSTNECLRKNGSEATVREGVGLTEVAGVATYNSSPNKSKYTVGRPLPEYIVGIFKVDLENEVYDNTKKQDCIGQLYYNKSENNEYQIHFKGLIGEENIGEICYCLPIEIDGYIGKYAKENGMLIRKHEDERIWIHTGDVGYIREDRNLVIKDRIKRVFNRNGFKVYPNAIENIAQSSGFIEECTVVPRKSYNNSEANVPIMYAVLKDKTFEQNFIEYCNSKIEGNSKIYQYIFVDELPRTGAGKKAYKKIELYDALINPLAGTETIDISIQKPLVLTLKKMKEILN